MDDQNKSTKMTPASHGDELDVLEAIYRLSKEKKVDILNTQQKHLLMNSGRATEADLEAIGRSSKQTKQDVSAEDLVLYIIEEAIVEVLVKNGVYTKEQWESKNKQLKTNLLRAYAFMMLGVDFEEWMIQLRKNKRI